VECPKCGLTSPDSAQFCVHCHYILIHHCPKCWHEQRSGNTCEVCGTNFALYWELAFERSLEEGNRLSWDRFESGVGAYLQILMLPFTSLRGLFRILVVRLVSLRLSSR
jgi:hypothetical protein